MKLEVAWDKRMKTEMAAAASLATRLLVRRAAWRRSKRPDRD